jgi:hypothetical protein
VPDKVSVPVAFVVPDTANVELFEKVKTPPLFTIKSGAVELAPTVTVWVFSMVTDISPELGTVVASTHVELSIDSSHVPVALQFPVALLLKYFASLSATRAPNWVRVVEMPNVRLPFPVAPLEAFVAQAAPTAVPSFLLSIFPASYNSESELGEVTEYAEKILVLVVAGNLAPFPNNITAVLSETVVIDGIVLITLVVGATTTEDVVTSNGFNELHPENATIAPETAVALATTLNV